jgi:hypothetical protein
VQAANAAQAAIRSGILRAYFIPQRFRIRTQQKHPRPAASRTGTDGPGRHAVGAGAGFAPLNTMGRFRLDR